MIARLIFGETASKINFIFQTTRQEFDAEEYKVRRRYQDFLWLRKRLEESNPTHIIPVRIF